MQINNEKLVQRWDNIMCDICVEHITINTKFSELETHKDYYGIQNGISTSWMLKEAEYWLSCYYESGNVRCDDKHYDEDSYKMWLSETGKLKRLIEKLKKMEDILVVEWN